MPAGSAGQGGMHESGDIPGCHRVLVTGTPRAVPGGEQEEHTRVDLSLGWRRAGATLHLLFCAAQEWREECGQQGCSVPAPTPQEL